MPQYRRPPGIMGGPCEHCGAGQSEHAGKTCAEVNAVMHARMAAAMNVKELAAEVPPASIRIGIVAYEMLPGKLVFVRVPNETGRWLLTHYCVAKVPCPLCGAVAGEPCFTNVRAAVPYRRYTVGTHYLRNRRAKPFQGREKVRLTPGDLTPGITPL